MGESELGYMKSSLTLDGTTSDTCRAAKAIDRHRMQHSDSLEQSRILNSEFENYIRQGHPTPRSLLHFICDSVWQRNQLAIAAAALAMRSCISTDFPIFAAAAFDSHLGKLLSRTSANLLQLCRLR